MKSQPAMVLVEYADRYATRAEQSGKGTQYPTIRRLATRFKMRSSQVIELIEDFDCWETAFDYVGLVVGIRVGGSVGSFDHEGEYQLEVWRKDV